MSIQDANLRMHRSVLKRARRPIKLVQVIKILIAALCCKLQYWTSLQEASEAFYLRTLLVSHEHQYHLSSKLIQGTDNSSLLFLFLANHVATLLQSHDKEVFLEHTLTLRMHDCRPDVVSSDSGHRIEHRGPPARDFMIFWSFGS